MSSVWFMKRGSFQFLQGIACLLFCVIPGFSQPLDNYNLQKYSSEADSSRIIREYCYYAHHPIPDSGIAGLKQVLADCRIISFHNYTMWTANELGNLYGDKGIHQQAIAYYEMAIRIALKQGGELSKYLSTGYNNLANIYTVEGDYSQAARMYFKAVLYIDYCGTYLNKASVLINLSYILVKLKQYNQADYYLRHAEQLAQQENRVNELANVHLMRGIIESAKAHWEESIDYLQKALVIARDNKLTLLEHVINCNIADNYYNQGREDIAGPLLEELLKLTQNTPSFYANHTELLLGKYYLNKGLYHKSEKVLVKALNVAETKNYITSLPQLHQLLSDLYKATGKYEKALMHKEQYITWKDSMDSRQTTWQVNQMEVKYRTLEKDRQIAENQLHIKDQKNRFKQKNLLLQVGIIGICSFSFFIFLIYRINLKKKEKQLSLLQSEQVLLQQKEISLIQEQEILQLKSIIQGEENERSRIARDLHDGLGALIAAIKLNLGAAVRKQHSQQQTVLLEETEQLMNDMAAEVRNIAHNLMPKNLLEKSLEEALLIYRNSVNAGEQLHINLHTYGDFSTLTNDSKLGIYRIIQELVQNIIKHAMATTATIQVLRVKDSLRITIEDDGRGFSPEDTSDGIGLQNVQLRVQAMQGSITIQPVSQTGTTIYIEFNFDHLTTEHSLRLAAH